MINQDRLKNLLIELIKIDSLSRKEREVALRLRHEMEELGAEVWIDDAGEKVGGNTGNLIAQFHGTAAAAKGSSRVVDVVGDRTLVDGSVNTFASWTWDFGLLLRRLQTGSLRQYVLFIVGGTLLVFITVTAVRLFA